MQSYLIRKSFSKHTKISNLHRTKTNEQSQILSATTFCKLAVQQSIFEKYQSCVCTTVTLSHRFKAFTPAFCGQNRFRYEPPEVSAKSFPAELWIVPGVQRFANLWRAFWFFLHDAKRINPSPFRELPRFSKPRISTPQRQLRTATIKTF